jgi:hypothetical protein
VAATGAISGAKLLAGANLGNDASIGGTGLAADIFLRPANIASITTGGVIDGSVISAGIAATNGVLGDADDVAGIAGLTTTGSKIGALKIGTAVPLAAVNGAVMHTAAIQAAAIGKLALTGVGGVAFTLPVVLDNGNTAGMDDAADIIVRLL